MKESISIQIAGKSFEVRQSFRALMLFEEMTGKTTSQVTENVTEIMKLFYCFLKGANKDFSYDFEEFIDLVDMQPGIFQDFSEYLQSMVPENVPKPTKKKQARH